ncbi:hypothetical protein GCM10025876_41530 [Demequina litorisediminis]|uniref:Uncharacterized protein n=1 Tax=Demequina litorisediminis TaxID=1849022 RepID=A0ABQ6IML5_9MICO|nr:hypothetical protein GCM10025876_41530 [Demequina litorisediminis]
MKDGTNADMLWGAVSKLGSRDFRMGKPAFLIECGLFCKYITGKRKTQGTETS